MEVCFERGSRPGSPTFDAYYESLPRAGVYVVRISLDDETYSSKLTVE